jgi:hypothetical protein
MTDPPSLATLLRSLRLAWLRGCEAAALHQRAAAAAAAPARLVVRPPAAAEAAGSPAFELDAAELVPPRWMRPQSLRLEFECELRRRPEGAWQLHIVAPRRWRWWGGRPRHRVEIVVDGATDAGGRILFDGQVWRRFGALRT